jgi:acyl-CoA reductase-like NAD-dependent aldehyde dehydrogenase
LSLAARHPVLVLPDADLAEVAAAIKIAGFWNAGQEYAAACRVPAADAIYNQLVAELTPEVESIRIGNPAEDPDLDMGPVISAEQQARVLGFLDRVARREARCSPAGRRAKARDSSCAPPSWLMWNCARRCWSGAPGSSPTRMRVIQP